MTKHELTQRYVSLLKQAEHAKDRKTAINLIHQSTKVKELMGAVTWADLVGEK